MHLAHQLHSGFRQGLGHDVCRHRRSGNVLDIYLAFLDNTSELVVVQIQVLHPTMVFRVLGDSNG